MNTPHRILTATVVFALALSPGMPGCRTDPSGPAAGTREQAASRDPAAVRGGAAAAGAPAQETRGSPPQLHNLEVHKSSIAGSWYPSDPGELRKLLEEYLQQAPRVDPDQARGLIAVIVPHAGYIYSGRTAARAYAILRESKPERIVLFGPSHHAGFHGISPGEYSGYETPLGVAPVDPCTSALLRECPLARSERSAHAVEHSLEIQIPILQVIFPAGVPPIVPVMFGDLEEADYPILARCLQGLIDDRTAVVVSSDFTHYGPRFQYLPFPADDSVEQNLRKLDEGAAERILKIDRPGFLAYRQRTGATICGFVPIAALLEILPRDSRSQQIFYETSGRLTGDFQNSVSYFALGFYRASRWGRAAGAGAGIKEEGKDMGKEIETGARRVPESGCLSEAEKASLLRLARDTVESYVRDGKMPDPSSAEYALTPGLKEKRGVFVTLKKHGELRGCIGYIQPIEPLYEAVQQNAVNAAMRDTRFLPVQPRELHSLEIEISALTKPVPIASYQDIVIGKHGVILQKGAYKAVFLPQVAPEQGWDVAETLRNLSLKAGLSADAWRDPQTKFEVFTAEVFHEQDTGGPRP